MGSLGRVLVLYTDIVSLAPATAGYPQLCGNAGWETGWNDRETSEAIL